MIADCWLCGWRVRSEIPMPELLAWRGDDREPDVTFRMGAVPARLADIVHEGRRLQVRADGACRVEIPGAAAFLVSGGRDVVIAPAAAADAAALRTFALGTVFGILCHQRGLVPLHASCVRIGDAAVAFAGRSGIGKSSVAAALWRLGYPLISDDVCVVARDGGGHRVMSAFPRLRLWRDGVGALDLDADRLAAVYEGLEKYTVPVGARFDVRPATLAAVYHLSDHVDSAGGLRHRLRGVDAFVKLCGALYRSRAAVDRRLERFAAVSRIAEDVPHWVLTRPASLERLHALAETAAGWHTTP